MADGTCHPEAVSQTWGGKEGWTDGGGKTRILKDQVLPHGSWVDLRLFFIFSMPSQRLLESDNMGMHLFFQNQIADVSADRLVIQTQRH